MTFAELKAEVIRRGQLDSTDDDTEGEAWTKAGLRRIGRSAPWPWLRMAWSVTLTNDIYEYAFSSLASDLFRIDTKACRYAGKTSYLHWRNLDVIDGLLGPEWRDDGESGGTPRYATRMGNNLWIAKKPNQDFIDDYDTLYGYGWRFEPSSGNLYLPEDFMDFAVDAALAWGLKMEDDPDWLKFEDLFQNRDLVEMKGARLHIGENDRMDTAAGARFDAETSYDYGDDIYY